MAFLDLKKQINKLLEAVKVDYVVEEGTDGNNWTYRKWNSGIAECWKNTAPKTTVASGWGSGYLSTQFSMSFPSGLFVEAPRVHLANNESYLAIPLGYKPTTNAIQYQLFRPTSVTTAQQFSIDFYAIGKWK